MNETERKYLVDELRSITRPWIMKTEAEHAADRARAAEICRLLGVEYPEDAYAA